MSNVVNIMLFYIVTSKTVSEPAPSPLLADYLWHVQTFGASDLVKKPNFNLM